MTLTEIRIVPAHDSNDRLAAYASIVIDACLVLHE